MTAGEEKLSQLLVHCYDCLRQVVLRALSVKNVTMIRDEPFLLKALHDFTLASRAKKRRWENGEKSCGNSLASPPSEFSKVFLFSIEESYWDCAARTIFLSRGNRDEAELIALPRFSEIG